MERGDEKYHLKRLFIVVSCILTAADTLSLCWTLGGSDQTWKFATRRGGGGGGGGDL